jgi:hypothetical protein
MRTQQLSDSYCTESSASHIKVAAICNLYISFCNTLWLSAKPNAELHLRLSADPNAELHLRLSAEPNAELHLILNWIKFFCNGTVWGSITIITNLLALVQWRSQAHACVTTAMIRLRLLPVTEWPQMPCQDSWLPWPRLVTPDLLTVNLT